MIEAMGAIARRHGLGDLIAPLRPTWKERYPLTPIQRYATWTREDGLPFDPWVRVHTRMGARIGPTIPHSLHITGSVAEWETWTQMPFPESGEYVFPAGLAPVRIDREQDLGEYWEPNIWLIHQPGQGAGRGGLPPGLPQGEGPGDGRVDAGPEAVVGAVPGQRNRVALGQDQFLVRVVQHELPLGEGVVELSPVMVQRVTVHVVLGPDLVRQVFDRVPEFRPLAVPDNLWFHGASIQPADVAGHRLSRLSIWRAMVRVGDENTGSSDTPAGATGG